MGKSLVQFKTKQNWQSLCLFQKTTEKKVERIPRSLEEMKEDQEKGSVSLENEAQNFKSKLPISSRIFPRTKIKQ